MYKSIRTLSPRGRRLTTKDTVVVESAAGPFSPDTLPGMPEFPVTVTFIADADTPEDADLAVRLTLSAAVESYRRSSSSPDIPWTRFV